MAIDVYELCPCGSGKKLKFCCAGIIDEMTKINRLQANDQPRQALAAIEKLEKSNPDNPWVGTVHGEILLSLGQIEEAQSRLEQLLKRIPTIRTLFRGPRWCFCSTRVTGRLNRRFCGPSKSVSHARPSMSACWRSHFLT